MKALDNSSFLGFEMKAWGFSLRSSIHGLGLSGALQESAS